jgi:hypothetical protein
VPGVGVQRFVEILRLLGELFCGTQVEVVSVGCPILAAAALADESRGAVGASDSPLAVRAADTRQETVGDHRSAAEDVTSRKSDSRRSARRSQV